jgi:hypothetical protein
MQHLERLVREYELLGAAQLCALDEYTADPETRKGQRCIELAWKRLACRNAIVGALEASRV